MNKKLTPITIHPFHILWNTDAMNSVDVMREARCGRKGHTYKDNSHFGPDSGTESHTCTSCGHNFSHTWY